MRGNPSRLIAQMPVEGFIVGDQPDLFDYGDRSSRKSNFSADCGFFPLDEKRGLVVLDKPTAVLSRNKGGSS